MTGAERNSIQKELQLCHRKASWWQGLLIETARSGSSDEFIERRTRICRSRVKEQEERARELSRRLG